MASGKNILVVGSSNTDMVIKTQRFPLPGETILGGNFFLFPGGKGANQAVAASRLGGTVTLVARVGNDIFGNKAIEHFKEENIQTRYVIRDSVHPSGTALITVDQHGENTIVVAQGSNAHLSIEDITSAASVFRKTDVLLIQLEIPVETVVAAANLAKSHGKKVILNPAPAASLPLALYEQLFLITPNRSEAEHLTGIKTNSLSSVAAAAEKLKQKGVANVLITMGPEGAYLLSDTKAGLIATRKVNAIDTTAAGDIFNGALAVAIAENSSLEEAVDFANSAAAISVTRMGAQSSAPYRKELRTEKITS
jgi:ribokinase